MKEKLNLKFLSEIFTNHNNFVMIFVILSLIFPALVTAQNDFIFSTEEDFSIGSFSAKDDNLVNFASGSFSLSALLPADVLPQEVDLDAYGEIGTTVIFSLDEDAEIAGTLYADEDLIKYDGSTFSLWFDGSGAGLAPEVNVDAVYIESESPQIFQFSLGEASEISGVGVVYKNDILRYNNGTIGVWSQGNEGWGISKSANLDALTKNPDTGDYVFSLDIEDTIGGTTFKKGDLINFSGSSFTKFFDSAAYGLDPSVNIDAIDNIQGGSGITPFVTETFDTQGLWNFYTSSFQAGPSNYGSYDSINKRIALKSPSGGWTTWYTWQIPYPNNNIITYTADSVYVLKAKLSADDNQTVPLVRLRVQSSDFVWEADLSPQCMNPNPASVPELGVPGTIPEDFMLIWEPQGSTSDAFLAFDEWEYGQGTTWTGEVYVEDFSIYRIPVSEINATAVQAISPITVFNTTSPYNWSSAAGVNVTASRIEYSDTSTWHGVGRLVSFDSAMTAGDIYRLKYNLSKNGTDSVDDPRLRVNDTQNGGYATSITFDDTRAESTKHVETTAKDFILYHSAKNPRASVAPFTGTDLAVWCDQITKVPSSNAIMYLNQIQIDKITLPTLN